MKHFNLANLARIVEEATGLPNDTAQVLVHERMAVSLLVADLSQPDASLGLVERLCAGGVAIAAAASNYSRFVISNPTGSGITAKSTRLYVGAGAAQQVWVGTYSGADLANPFSKAFLRQEITGGPALVGTYDNSGAVALTLDSVYGPFYVPASESIPFDLPFVLTPGKKVGIYGRTVNTALTVALAWNETDAA